MSRIYLFSSFLLLTLLSGLVLAAPAPDELSWDALMPEDFNPEWLFEKYNPDELEDSDPRAIEFMRELKAVWKVAPVVDELAGRQVKIPGFVMPLKTRGETVREFFLMPYFGSCIHVPPPPANQVIYVIMPPNQGLPAGSLYSTVWVSGKLQIKRTSNKLGAAGYLIENAIVEPYQEE